MPKISVIIPAFNSEKTIQETVQSVLVQTFKDFELIVVNDGSTDSTLKILSVIEDHRLKVFSYPNAGSNPTRNRGFSHSSGDYIAFLDADDLWTEDKLEVQLKALQETPQAAVAYSWSDRINEFSQFLYEGGHFTADGDVYAHLLLADILENGSNPLIRREAFIRVGGFDESLPAGQDWDLYLRLAARYQFTNIPRPQILYRISDSSLSSNVSKLEAGCLQVINRAFEQAPESLQYLKQDSFANIYKYLTYKSLRGYPHRSKGLMAVKYIWLAIKYDSSLLQRRILWKVLLKITISVIFPFQLNQILVAKMQGLADVASLMRLLRFNP